MAKVAPKKMQALVAKRKSPPPFGKKSKAAAPPPEPEDDEDDAEEEDDEELDTGEGGATDHEEPDGDEPPVDEPPVAASEGDPGAEGDVGGSEEDDQALVDDAEEAITSGDRDPQLEALMDGFEPDGPPPPWAQDSDTWDRAVLAVDPDGGFHDEPWLLVAHVYKAMGGQVNPGNMPSNAGDGGEDAPPTEPDDGGGY